MCVYTHTHIYLNDEVYDWSLEECTIIVIYTHIKDNITAGKVIERKMLASRNNYDCLIMLTEVF